MTPRHELQHRTGTEKSPCNSTASLSARKPKKKKRNAAKICLQDSDKRCLEKLKSRTVAAATAAGKRPRATLFIYLLI